MPKLYLDAEDDLMGRTDPCFDMPSHRDHLHRYRAYFSDVTTLDIEAHYLSEAWGIAHDRAYLENKRVMTVEEKP